MKYFESVPHPLLRRFVDRYWGWENEANERIVLPTLLAGTGADLFFHYREPFSHTIAGRIERLPASHLVCVRQRALHLQPSTHLGFVAVRFRVGGLRAFTRIPGSELLDCTPSAAHLWPLTHHDVDAGGRASSVAGCITRIERHLLAHLVPDPDLLALAVVQRIYRCSDRIDLRGVAASAGVSPRQLERRVKAWTGQSPIEIRSCSRLQKTIRMLALRPDVGVLDAALAQGYFDQSHFSKAFVRMGVGSPDRFRTAGGLLTHFYKTSLPGVS